MYEFIEGTVAYKKEDYFVINSGGIGYKIFCQFPLIDRIPSVGTKTLVYTHLIVREDLMALYGFTNPEELSMFELMLSVSGIGPKVAGSVVANIEPSKFAVAVLSSDIETIKQVKGIGKKGAERIILELKDKLKGISFESLDEDIKISKREIKIESKYKEACSALAVLGYSPSLAEQAVKKAYNQDMELEEIIKQALRELI